MPFLLPRSHSGCCGRTSVLHTRGSQGRSSELLEQPSDPSPRDPQAGLLPPPSTGQQAGKETPEKEGLEIVSRFPGGFIRSDIRASRAPAHARGLTRAHTAAHTCAHTAARAHTAAHMCAQLHMHTQLHIHVRTQLYMHTVARACVHMQLYTVPHTCAHIAAYSHVCAHSCKHTCTAAHTRVHIQLQPRRACHPSGTNG